MALMACLFSVLILLSFLIVGVVVVAVAVADLICLLVGCAVIRAKGCVCRSIKATAPAAAAAVALVMVIFVVFVGSDFFFSFLCLLCVCRFAVNLKI